MLRPKVPTSDALRVSSSAGAIGSVPIRFISATISVATSGAVGFLVCVRAAISPGSRRAVALLPAP